MRPANRLAIGVLSALAVVAAAASAVAQYDNRLTRDNRLEPSYQPMSPADRAFDPRSQVAVAEPPTTQRAQANVVGSVPITAGPGGMPIVTIEGPSLQALPGDRWLTVLYVNNNSGSPVDPRIDCTFINGGHPVQDTHVIVPTTAAGMRLSVPVYGPRVNAYVDRVACRVVSP